MTCPNCGKTIGDDVKFCPWCGVEFLDEPQPWVQVQPEPVDSADPPYQQSAYPQQPGAYAQQPQAAPASSRSKWPLIVVCAVVIAAVVAAVGVLVWAFKSGRLGAKEYVTDAMGSTVAVGTGDVTISVRDPDGSVRQIKSDSDLMEYADILTEYTAVMNDLKASAPGFTKTRWQDLPADKQSLGGLGGLVLPIIEKHVTGKDAKEAESFPSGNADELPLLGSMHGCLLTDPTKIKNAYCEVLEDGYYQIVMTLVDEADPTPLSAGADSTSSAISSVFYPFSVQNMISSVASLALTDISFLYTDCTVTLVYAPKSHQVRRVYMNMNIDVSASSGLGSISARIVDNTEYTDFVY